MNLPKSKTAKLISGVTGVAVALSFALSIAAPASADTISDLMAQINALTAQLNQLKGSSTGTTSTVTGSLTKDLQVGSKGDEVMTLQKILNKSADTQVAASGAGSPGMETSTFGPATKAAVMKFQKKYGITPTSGYVGPKTRAQLNTMTGGVSTGTGTGTTTTAPKGTGLTVTAASQPAASLAPQGASRVPFTKVTLTASNDGDIVVNGVTVERTGLAQDAVFSGLVLLDENGLQIGTSKTLNSNHQVTVGEPFTIKAGQSKTVTIAGNMATPLTSYAGQVAAISIVGVNTSATVNGSFPINGTGQTINATLTLGSATMNVSSFDPNSAQTKQVGDTGVKFAGVRIQAGSAEKIRVWSVRFNQSGSASSNDLANVKVYVGGTAYPTTVSADGKYYTALFGQGIVIDKGTSNDIYVQGDVVGTGAANRTVQFDLYKTTDIYLTGETYGYGITPTPSANTASAATTGSEFVTSDGTTSGTASSPWFSGSTVTISAGSASSISKANSVAAQNIALNVPNQVLGGYQTDIKGEPISVQSAIFKFNYGSSAASSYAITNVSIYDENGAVVAGPVDAVNVGGTEQKVTFTDTITYPVGQHVYTLKGKLPSGLANNETITASTTPSGWSNITGQITGNTLSFSGLGVFTLNQMTIKAASLAVSVSATPAAQNIIAGATGVTFANYQLDATQSGEDVRFSSIPLQVTLAGGAATSSLTSCQLYDGSTALNTGSNVVNPTGTSNVSGSTQNFTFTFDQSLTVPKGTVKTLTLKCNVASSASSSNTFSWGVRSGTDISVTGVTSGGDVSENITAAAGQTMTIQTGSLTVSTDSSSPSYAVVAANTTGNVVGAYKFRATNDAVNLSRIGLKLTNTASSSPSDLVQVSIWDGATQVGTATFVGASTNATSTLSSVVVLPKDADKVLTIKADLAAQGTSQPATPGHLIAIDVDVNTNTQGTGAGSGATINATGSTSVAGVRVFKSFPVFTYSTTGATLINGVNDLLVLNVAANSTGEVKLNKLSFTLATTTVTLASPTFSGPNGNVSSSTNSSLNAAGTSITVFFDSSSNTADAIIPAGGSKTYTLRGTISGLTGSNSGSASVALKADTSYPSLSGFMAATSSLTASNIIWSPSSTSTQSVSGALDWTNGYGLGGCFTSSGLGNDCTARVLAK